MTRPINNENSGLTAAADAVEFDIRGQICPSCLLLALREVNARKEALRNGQVRLCIRTDSRDAITTIPDAMQNMGYAVAVTKDRGHYLITIAAHAR